MSLIKKRDVKMYFAARRRRNVAPMLGASMPATAALPASDSVLDEDEAAFAEDFSGEHCSPGGTVTAVVIVTECNEDAGLDETPTPRP
jgi:hypothetical protein